MNKLTIPRNILALTREEKQQFLNSFDNVFSDIDGVVWNLSHTIEGCADAYQALRDSGKYLTFITNNSVRPEEDCLGKLNKLKIPIEAKDLMHPAKSVVEYLKSINFEGTIYAMASENFINMLRKQGYNVLEGPNIIINESYDDIYTNVLTNEDVKAVIVDFDFNLSQIKMMKAFYYLRNPNCLLIGGATDYVMPISKELSLLGPGGYIKILEQTSHRKILEFGKPGKHLAELLLKRCHIMDPHRILMIGDMMGQDIRFARQCGFQSLLVLSGGTSLDDMRAQTDINCVPNYYANSVGDFVEIFKDINKSDL